MSKRNSANWLIRIILLTIIIIVKHTPIYAQYDNFNLTHSYMGGNVAGTPWSGLMNSGIMTTGDANSSNAGQLTIASAGGMWENSNTTGPFLYNNVTGDFVAEVEITSANNIAWHDPGLMARPANLADGGAGEDHVLVRYFVPGGFNSLRSTDNGSTTNINSGFFYRFLRLVRTGNVFYAYGKNLSADPWTQLAGSPITRNDLSGLPLQVGICDATYTGNTGTVQANDILIYPGVLTSGINFSGVTTNSSAISWTAGNGTMRAVFIKQAATGSALPLNGITYSPSLVFGSGSQIGTTGWYCVYNGTASSITVTGLSSSTTYVVSVVEYFGTAGFEAYNLASYSGNNANFTTLVCPVITGNLVSQINVACNGNATGSANVSATGGTAFTYSWSPSGGTSAVASGLTAGLFTCTITNECGSSSTLSVNITQPTPLASSSSATSILCNGDSSTVTVAGSGGTSPYTGEGTFTELAGAYSYTVTDANGCTSSTSITITEPTPLTSSSSATSILCNGGNSTVTVNASGGTIPYSGTGSFIVTAGTHNYTVTDNNGCSSSSSITITEPTPLTSSSSATSILCNGGSSTVTVAGSGGTSPYTGEGTFTELAGTYSYTVTDANGCTSSTSITITEPTPLTSSSSATSILCNGGNSTVTVNGSGGTSPYAGTGTYTVTAGTYNYTVTDANGCTSSTSITITEPTPLTSSSSATSILCNGGSSTVTVAGSGGTSPYTGEGTFTELAGTYSYTVTDANGCTSATTITITEPTAISTSVVAVNVDCYGDSTGSIDLTVSGGTAPYTFDWNSGTYTTEDLTGLGAGTYVGVLTDANGCTDGGTIVISEPAVLVALVSSASDPVTCSGLEGSIDISVSGGTSGYSFAWSNAATNEDISALAAGIYSCTVTDTNGCTATVSDTLYDPAAPIVTLAVSSDTLCLADAALPLTGESPAGGIFSGVGVSAGMFDPTVAGIGVHVVTYTYTDPVTLCTDSVTDSIYVDVCLGTSSLSSVSSPFSVFPNPNNGTFTLLLNTSEVADVMIYDALGQLVSTEKVQSQQAVSVNLHEPGLYLVTIIIADGLRFSQPVVVRE